MPKNCMAIVDALRAYLATQGLAETDVAVRVSMGTDLARVRQFGTTRAGLSDKPWDKAHCVDASRFPNGIPRHDEMVIASRFADLDADAKLPYGTLAHKLDLYAAPFLTLYDITALEEVLSENSTTDPTNQGSHWLFKVADKRTAIRGLLGVQLASDGTPSLTVLDVLPC